MKKFIRQKLYEAFGWEDEKKSPLRQALEKIQTYPREHWEELLMKFESDYEATYAQYKGDTYGVIDAIDREIPEALKSTYDEMHPKVMVKEGGSDTLSNFLKDLNATIDPKTKKAYEFKLGPSKITFRPSRNKNTIALELIETPKGSRGAGHATTILTKFIEVVDKYGFTIELIISPRDSETSFEKLANFYQTFGFNYSQEGGVDSDFEMIR